MAKDKQNVNYDNGIQTANISAACTEYMKIFGANNNLMRHLPGVLDGLKIGERRILYTMYKMGISYNGSRVKVNTIVGNTLQYHPHGDAPVYETLVKLGQPWNNIQCTIDGKGNFGNIAGAPAAAGRYIEARLSYYAYKCFFEEFSEDIVDMKPNYDDTKLEPEFLPARYPNVLINNVFGIGYGISTSICTYNLKEVLEATIELIENPEIDNIVLYPDSPTGAYIVDEGQFEQLSATGKGRFKMRGVIEVDEDNNILHVRSTPLQVSWESVKKSVFALLNDGKSNMMRDFKDQSDDTHMHYEIYLKKEIDPYAVLHMIYSKTQMEKTLPVSFKLIEDWSDNDYTIKSILQTWIDFRRETKRRSFNNKLLRSKERQHILEILLFILNKDNGEKTLQIIKKSENKKEIIKRLMETYGISSLQADSIAEMRLNAFSKEAYKKYMAEKEEIDKTVKELESIVRSAKKIDKVIISELKEGIKLFAEERRSQIITIDNEVKVRDTNHVIVFTKNGFVKKLPDDVKNVGYINTGDYPIDIVHAKNTSELLIFDQSGKITKLPVHKIRGCALNTEGFKLSDIVMINGDIKTIKPKPTIESLEKIKEPVYFLMITKKGIIKKTLANAYTNIKNELLGLIVRDDDELVCVKLLAGEKDIVVYTSSGLGVRFNSEEIRETSRMSVGVKAISMSDDDTIVGMDIVNPKDQYILVITHKGNAKKCTLSTFKTMNRADKPLRIVTLDENDEIFKIRTIHGNEKFKLFTKDSLESIDCEDIVELPRLSKGKKTIPVRKGNVLIELFEI